MNVYNTHLCAGECTVGELGNQVNAVLKFVRKTERIFSFGGRRHRPYVLGGDFNMDNFRNLPDEGEFGPEKELYDNILEAGFIDAYAKVNSATPDFPNDLCEDPNNPDTHCTVGVSDYNGSNARRIDYVFADRRYFNSQESISDGMVVFNTLVNGESPSVSDHAAVLVTLKLP